VTLVDEVRARREQQENEREDAWAHRQYKKRVQADNEQQRQLYDEGRKEGADEERRRADRKSPGGRRSQSPRANHSRRSRGRTAPRRRQPTPREVAQQVVQPHIASGTRVLGLTLLVLALYLVLESAPAVTGVLGGVNKVLEWLRSPAATIPYANGG
jgi:hypothetical protein